MFIYTPHNQKILAKRLDQAQQILEEIPTKYCFITGSYLYKEKYKDIDIFIISRSKKSFKLKSKNITLTILDFNQLYSLLYHSLSKSCIAKNVLPKKDLKLTISDYWTVINEAVPTLYNRGKNFKKSIRFLVLYTEYFKTGEVLDSFQLAEKVASFRSTKEVIEYLKKEVPVVMKQHASFTYLKRFFYTQAAVYKELKEYKAQSFLYELTHLITKINK